MAEALSQNRTPDSYLKEAGDRLAAGGLDDNGMAEVAVLALNAAGITEIDRDNDAELDALNKRLDAVLALNQNPEHDKAIRDLADRLATQANLSNEQIQQARAIIALADRRPVYEAARQKADPDPRLAALGRAASASWRKRQGGGAPGGAGTAHSGTKGAAAARKRAAGAGGPGPGAGPGPAKANTAGEDTDTLTKRFEILVARAKAANAQKGNGIEKERNLSVDEALLREILRALEVNPEVELPITTDRRHPETGINASVEDSLEFIAEARQLYLQLIARPKVPENPKPGYEIFEYRGPGLAGGKNKDSIQAYLVDKLGALTEYRRWIVDPPTRDRYGDTLRQLFIGEKKHFLTDGSRGIRQRLRFAYEGAGWSINEKGPRPQPLGRISRPGPGGAVAHDRQFPNWNLDSRLITFHRAQILKRMMLSNELRIAEKIGEVRLGTVQSDDDLDDPKFEEILDRRMTPFLPQITGLARNIDRGYRNWLDTLYDGIDPRDGTLILPGTPLPPVPARGPGARYGFNRHPAGVRLHHRGFPQAGAIALGDTLLGSWGVVPPVQPGHTARGFVSPRGGAGSVLPAEADPGRSPVEQTKIRIQKLHQADVARRKAEARDERKLRRRTRVAGFAGGVLLALPEPIQDRVAAAVQKSNAKRKRHVVPGQSHS